MKKLRLVALLLTSFVALASTISLAATYPYIWQTQPRQIHSGLTILSSQITAILDVAPDPLNLRSMGKWITAYIQLPEEYNPENIAASTILLNETIQPVLDPKYGFVTNSSEYLVDHNNDGILERMVKFNRTMASSLILSKGIRYGHVTLTVIGQLNDGTSFEGSDIIMVRMPGDVEARCARFRRVKHYADHKDDLNVLGGQAS